MAPCAGSRRPLAPDGVNTTSAALDEKLETPADATNFNFPQARDLYL